MTGRDLGLGFVLEPVPGVAIEEDDTGLILDAPGVSAWLSVVGNDDAADISTRLEQVRSEQPVRARKVRQRAEDGVLHYAYRDEEDDDAGGRRVVVRGFVFGRLGHVEMLAHPADEGSVATAFALVDAVALDATALEQSLAASMLDGDPFSGSHFRIERMAGSLAASNAYRVRDVASGAPLFDGREPALGAGVDLARLLVPGRWLVRFKIVLRSLDGTTVLTLRRGFARPLAMAEVLDADGRPLGSIKPCWWSPFGTHDVLDAQGRRLARLRFTWVGDEVRFERDGSVVARITHAGPGLLSGRGDAGDELEIASGIAADEPLRRLLLAAAIFLDVRAKD